MSQLKVNAGLPSGKFEKEQAAQGEKVFTALRVLLRPPGRPGGGELVRRARRVVRLTALLDQGEGRTAP